MLPLAQFLAVLSCGLVAGAALYISVGEYPARLDGGSRKSGTVMQASLALIACLAGVVAWWQGGGWIWLLGAALIGMVVPFTLVPTWARLHAVRTVLSLLALIAYLTTLLEGVYIPD